MNLDLLFNYNYEASDKSGTSSTPVVDTSQLWLRDPVHTQKVHLRQNHIQRELASSTKTLPQKQEAPASIVG